MSLVEKFPEVIKAVNKAALIEGGRMLESSLVSVEESLRKEVEFFSSHLVLCVCVSLSSSL